MDHVARVPLGGRVTDAATTLSFTAEFQVKPIDRGYTVAGWVITWV